MAKTKEITALQVLSEMDRLDRIRKAPNMPPQYIIGTKFPEKNANNIENAIEKFAKIVGFLAERTKTAGRKLEAKYINTVHGRVQVQKETFIPGTSKKGSSDMKLLIQGKYITAEIKFGKDTQKEKQKEYQELVTKNGGEYVIFKTFQDFLIWYVSKFGSPAIMQEAIYNLTPKKNS